MGVRATLPGQTPHETSLYMRRHAFWHVSDQVIADTAEMQPDWRGDVKDIAGYVGNNSNINSRDAMYQSQTNTEVAEASVKDRVE